MTVSASMGPVLFFICALVQVNGFVVQSGGKSRGSSMRMMATSPKKKVSVDEEMLGHNLV